MSKKSIKLTESKLRKIVNESINKVVRESYSEMDFDDGFDAWPRGNGFGTASRGLRKGSG